MCMCVCRYLGTRARGSAFKTFTFIKNSRFGSLGLWDSIDIATGDFVRVRGEVLPPRLCGVIILHKFSSRYIVYESHVDRVCIFA